MGTQSEHEVPKFRVSWIDRTYVLASVLLFVIVTILVYSIHRDAIFFRYDGTFLLSVAKNQYHWLVNPALGQLDMLKGVGDMTFPTFMHLIPGYFIPPLITGRDVDPVASCVIFALEFFAAACFLLLRLGATARVAVTASWIVCLVTLPYFTPTLTFTRLWGNPHFLEAISIVAVATVMFLDVGRKTGLGDFLRAIAIFSLLALLTMSQPVAIVIAALPLVAYFLFAIAIASTSRERWLKCAVAGGVAGALAIIFGYYMWGLYAFTQVTYFWDDLEVVQMHWWEFSFFMHRHEAGGLFGAVFAGFCVLIALSNAFDRTSPLRRVAWLFLIFVGALAATAAFGSLIPQWRGPPLGYLDLFMLPLYGLFAARGIMALLDWITGLAMRFWPRLKEPMARQAAPLLVLAALPFIPMALAKPPFEKPLFRNHDPFVWPPGATPITRFLSDHTRLIPDKPFRGRVVNLAGAKGEYSVLFHNQHAYDAGNLYWASNEHRMYGLWFFDIPTLTTSNQFMSPYYFLVISRFLNPPGSIFTRAQVQLTVFHRPTLERLGVRYVITDTPLPVQAGLTLVTSMKLVEGRDNYVYEIEGTNISGVSPTETVRVNSAHAWVDQLADVKFNYRTTAVVDTDLPKNLTSATSSSIIIERDALHVTARSNGQSLLVIPLEYSRCLVTTPNEGRSGVTLVRTNLNQTGILFEGALDVRLRLRFGPWINQGCRFAEIEDAHRLNLSGVQRYWPEMK